MILVIVLCGTYTAQSYPATTQVSEVPDVVQVLDDDMSRLNVLLYVMDTVRSDHLSLYGYQRETSPFLEELADDGALWWTCTSASTWTWPSVCSLLTSVGLPSHRCYGRNTQLSSGWKTIPEILGDEGYSTSLVTSNEVLRPKGRGLSTRFDRSIFPRRPDSNLTQALSDLLRDPTNRPFFIYAQPLAAHQPYRNSAPFDSLFVGDPYYGGLGDLPELNWSGADCAGGMIATNVLQEETSMDWYVSQYDGLIADADEQLRRIFEVLEEEGLEDSTVVVITADHGEELSGEHGYYFCHRDHYAGNVTVPLLMVLPAFLAKRTGARSDGDAMHLDIVPTILDVLGLPPLPQAQGNTLLQDPMTETLFEHDPLGGVLLEGGYKIIQAGPFPEPDAPIELYDLVVDPGEEVDRADEYPALARRMGADLDEITASMLAASPPLDVSGVLFLSDLDRPDETEDYFAPDLHMTGQSSWVLREGPSEGRFLSAATDSTGEPVRLNLEVYGPSLADYHARAQIRLQGGRLEFATSTIAGASGYVATLAPWGVSLRKIEIDGVSLPLGTAAWSFDADRWYDVSLTNDGVSICIEIDGETLVCGSDPEPGSVFGNTSWSALPNSRIDIAEIEIWR